METGDRETGFRETGGRSQVAILSSKFVVDTPPPPDTPLAACCDTENTADVDQMHGWVRDLTQEGVEPNPGPTGGATDDDSKVRVNFVVLECRVGLLTLFCAP
jgi:hypothetical protein